MTTTTTHGAPKTAADLRREAKTEYDQALAIQAQANASAGGKLTPEDVTKIKFHLSQFAELKNAAQALDDLDDAGAIVSRPLPLKSKASDPERYGPSARFSSRYGFEAPPDRGADRRPGLGGKSYAEMFPRVGADTAGWSNANEFLTTIGMGLGDQRLQLSAAMDSGHGSAGGFLVPPGFAREFLDSALEREVIRPRARVFPMVTEDLRVPGFDDSDNSTSVYGFSMQWLAEGETASRGTGKVRSVVLEAKKAAIYVAASSELIEDGFDFQAQLSERLSEGLAFGLDDSFLNGNGAGMPLGIVKAGCTVTVSKEGSQAADTIRYENVVKMFARLLPTSTRNAVWLAHPSCLPQLMSITVPIKNVAGTENVGGGLIPILKETNGELSLLGRPLILTEKAQPLGDLGDLALCDLSFYAIGLRADLAIERSNAPGWLQDQTDFRVRVRLDGQPLLAKPHTPKYGADTLSPFVILEAR